MNNHSQPHELQPFSPPPWCWHSKLRSPGSLCRDSDRRRREVWANCGRGRTWNQLTIETTSIKQQVSSFLNGHVSNSRTYQESDDVMFFFCFSELFQVVTFQSSLDWIKRWTTDFGHEKWKNKLGSLHLEMRNEHSCKIHKWLVDFRTRLAVSKLYQLSQEARLRICDRWCQRPFKLFFFQNWGYLHCIFLFRWSMLVSLLWRTS